MAEEGRRVRVADDRAGQREATVYIPASDADSVTEGGKPLDEVEGVELVGVDDGRVQLRLGSGQYEFVSN